MRTSDFTLSIIVFLIFVALYAFNILAVGVADIKRNWPIYRCNPLVMPFASSFGYDAQQNFTQCVQTMQKEYMTELLEPINYNLGVMGQVGQNFGTALTDMRSFVSNIRGRITSIVGGIFGTFLNLLIQMQKTIITIKDTFDKTSGIMAATLYTLSGSVLTTQSMWNGPPGQMVRALCFDPDTILRLQSGENVKMKDIELGDTLSDGSVVCSTMRIKNFDKDGNSLFPFYCVPGGENEQYVRVTGSHLVESPLESGKFIPVSEHPEALIDANEPTKWFSCLITDTHKIPIGRHVFHDWEDNNGSPSKDLY